jgi:hypothetical protein
VAAGTVGGIGTAAVMGGRFEELRAASADFAGAAAMWGYTSKKA